MHFKWYVLGFLIIFAVGCGSTASVSTKSRDDLLEFATTQSSVPGYWSDRTKDFGGQFNLKFTKVLTPSDAWKTEKGQRLCQVTGKGEIWEKGRLASPFTISGASIGRKIRLMLTFADGTSGSAEGAIKGSNVWDASCVIKFTYRNQEYVEDVFIASASTQENQRERFFAPTN